jgi:energy-coupling factor transport system permease protein
MLILLGVLLLPLSNAKMVREFFKGLAGIQFLIIFILIINTVLLSLNFAIVTILRIVVLMGAFSLYFQTTLPEDLTQSLISLGFKYPYAFAISLAFRFVPTMALETEIIMEAQKSRGHRIQEGGVIQQIRNLFPLLIPLLFNSIRRAYNVAEALESRAFGVYPKPTFFYPIRFTAKDGAIVIGSILFLITGILLVNNISSMPGWLQWNMSI